MNMEYAGDEIRVKKLEVFAHHGVYPKETEEGQKIMCEAMREIMEEVAREERAEGVKAGRIEGKMEALASLVRQGIITASEGARQAGMGEDIFAVHLSQNN